METDLLQYNFFCKVKNTTSATTTQNKNNNTNTNKRVELKENNFITTNEIKISNKIKTIPYYYIYFQLMTSSKLLRDLQKIPEILNNVNHEMYVLVNYPENNGSYLKDFLFTLKIGRAHV